MGREDGGGGKGRALEEDRIEWVFGGEPKVSKGEKSMYRERERKRKRRKKNGGN